MRAEPPPTTAYGRLAVTEARMLAYLACTAAAGQTVSAQDLALLPGSAGRPLGLREALETVRDLMDGGWVLLPGLVAAAKHEQVRVFTPGFKRPAAPRAVATVVEVPVEKAVVKYVTTPAGAETAEPVGRLGKKLPIPASLPQELRTELLALAAAYEGGGPSDPHELLALTERRAAALAAWSTLPHATPRVCTEAERIKTTLATARNHPAVRAAAQTVRPRRERPQPNTGQSGSDPAAHGRSGPPPCRARAEETANAGRPPEA
jgi:hypothetical protein